MQRPIFIPKPQLALAPPVHLGPNNNGNEEDRSNAQRRENCARQGVRQRQHCYSATISESRSLVIENGAANDEI